MLAQHAVLQKQIWIAPDDDGQRSLPVEAEEMRRALKGWRTVSDVARAFAGYEPDELPLLHAAIIKGDSF